MMLTISPMLALISLLAVPLSLVVTILIAKRSQKQFVRPVGVDRQRSTGTSRRCTPATRSSRSSGARSEAIETFDDENERLYEASYRAQFISGIIQPALNFISNLNYVAIAVIGGLQVAAGPDVPGRRDRVHPVLAPVHASRSSRRRASSTSSSRPSPRPSASSSCSTSRRRSPIRSQPGPARAAPRRGRLRGRLVPLRAGQAAHRGPGPRRRGRAARSPSWARPAPARRPSSTC